MKERKLGSVMAFWTAFLGAALYVAAKLAMVYYVGIPFAELESGFYETVTQHPFEIRAAEHTAALCVIAVVGWLVLLASYMVSYGKYMRGAEHGRAEWANRAQLKKRYTQKLNLILSKNLRLGHDFHLHKLNLNILLVGGPGSGKTRFFVLPNLMQANADFVITDPKGEILRNVGGMLKEKGYRIRVLNLVDMEKSSRYNPLAYVERDSDIFTLVTAFIKSTTNKNGGKDEQFWMNMAEALLQAQLLYLWHEAPVYEQNFGMVIEMLRYMVVREDDENYVSPLDRLFAELRERDPDHVALKSWDLIRNSPGKTLKSIKMTLVSRLNKILIPEVAELMSEDEMELRLLGKGEKTALFCVVPDNDTTYVRPDRAFCIAV